MCMLQSLSVSDKACKKLRFSNDLHSLRNMVLHSLEGDQFTSRVFHSYAAVDHVMNECSNFLLIRFFDVLLYRTVNLTLFNYKQK